MKKTTLDVIQDIRSLVLPIVSSLNGGDIYPYTRAKSSVKNDVVINVLGTSNDYIQFSIVNVNIHVPNMIITLPNNAGKDDSQPDLAKFSNLVSLIKPLLDNQWKPSFHVEFRMDNGLVRDSDGSHYYNLQINYFAYQGSNSLN